MVGKGLNEVRELVSDSLHSHACTNVKVYICFPAVACGNTADISVQGATKALPTKSSPELGELECARLLQVS